MAATNTSVLSYGMLLQLGAGDTVAGTNQVSTITFGGAPSAGSVTLSFWGIPFTFSTASGLPTQTAFQTLLNGIFGTKYVNPFTVALASNTYTVTAAGPFANMPLPAFQTVSNTSLQTIQHQITTPGVYTETFTTVANVEQMPLPQPTADVETYVTYSAANDRYKQKIKKFKDAGQSTMILTLLNDPSQNNITGIQSLFESPSAYDFRLVFPTQVANPTTTVQGYTDYGTAFVTQFMTTGDVADARARLTCRLDWDGPILRFPPLA